MFLYETKLQKPDVFKYKFRYSLDPLQVVINQLAIINRFRANFPQLTIPPDGVWEEGNVQEEGKQL